MFSEKKEKKSVVVIVLVQDWVSIFAKRIYVGVLIFVIGKSKKNFRYYKTDGNVQ